MTDSKTPDWVKEEAENLAKEAVRKAFRDPLMPMYIPMVPMLAQALLSAYERGRKEGIEEAAKVAFKQAPATQDWADAPLQDQARRTATAIRQLLEGKG